MSRTSGARLGILLLVALPLVACSSAVKVAPFDGAETPECHAVGAHWPTRVGPAEWRETAVDSVTVAAWGDPAIIARCGAVPPGPTEQLCLDSAGVDWIVEELDDGTSFTTYGRSPAIEVLVPDAYDTPALLLPAFGPAAETVEQGPNRCS
ncbi:DUF3515 family protein [Ornithinimicrobium cavernae]|uniref:DUF3515 family protein n=1 Tax=Ornithinimicrobium cavernae TaxID=2666047 RepID=UPI001F470AE3|nr:DUF3515 family protein [Ornithinimicrobium cavernae]